MRFALLFALLAAPALAAPFEPPEGCTGKLTVQYRSCLVANYWTCEGEPDGMQWGALFNANGITRLRQVDSEYQWLITRYFQPDTTQRMQLPAPDPESLDELFATGNDTYDFTVVEDGSGQTRRYVGHDRITGETVIDGEPLMTTAYAYTVYSSDGTVISQIEGRQYVSQSQRLFHFGRNWDPASPEDVSDDSPVRFIYPGERGFFSADPVYGCDMMMSSLNQSMESAS